MEEKNIAGLIIICTGKYDRFLPGLFSSADRYFLTGHDIDIYLFNDREYTASIPSRFSLFQMRIPHLPFPMPTLLRYKWISEFADALIARNLFYIDADMVFENPVGEEIIPSLGFLTATYHPGFYVNKGWGDHDTPIQSTAYLKPSQRHNYFAGGFQGGSRDAFLIAAKILSEYIDVDFDTAKDMGWNKNNGILARWHDETHWNHYLKYFDNFITLSPEYCMVEEYELRTKWKIDHLTPRIVALKKNHKEIRS